MHLKHKLAIVGAVEQLEEGLREGLQSLHHVLAPFQFSGGEEGALNDT